MPKQRCKHREPTRALSQTRGHAGSLLSRDESSPPPGTAKMGKVTHACTSVIPVHLKKKCSTEACFEQDQGVFCQAIEICTTSAVCCLPMERQAAYTGKHGAQWKSERTMSNYIFENAAPQASQRFSSLETLYDPWTIRHLEATSIGPGWQCWEVGAGGGSIAAWLGERSGPIGFILVTDIDPRFLVESALLDQPTIEI